DEETELIRASRPRVKIRAGKADKIDITRTLLLPSPFVSSRCRSRESGPRPLPAAHLRRAIMRRAVLLIGLLSLLSGCTHITLRNDTVRTTNTLADLQFQQVLDNVARFHDNPDTVPSFAVATAGTVSVLDTAGAGVSPTYSPTLTFQQQGGGALPILSLLFP